MPNVACNTSSFLKSNCKYMRTAESESRSQLNGEGEAHTCLFEYRRVLEMCAGALDSHREPVLHLESDGRTDAGL